MEKWLKKNWRRYFIIVICLGLVAARQLWPRIQVDAITIWLVVIAAIFFLIPDPKFMIPYIKRVRFGEAEIELKEEVKELGKEVEKVQQTVTNKPIQEISKDLSSDINEILRMSSSNPRAAFLLLSETIEQVVKKRLQEAGLKEDSSNTSMPQAIKVGVDAGIFPSRIQDAFLAFWGIRNRVAHDVAFDVEDSTILSLVSLGTELLKLISTDGTT